MRNTTTPPLRVIPARRAHTRSPIGRAPGDRRQQLAHRLGDGVLACAWTAHRNERPAAPRSRHPIAEAAAFATWCHHAAGVGADEQIDPEALTQQWDTQARGAGTYGHVWHIDALAALATALALTVLCRCGLTPSGVILTGVLVAAIEVMRTPAAPRPVVGPQARSPAPIWGLR